MHILNYYRLAQISISTCYIMHVTSCYRQAPILRQSRVHALYKSISETILKHIPYFIGTIRHYNILLIDKIWAKMWRSWIIVIRNIIQGLIKLFDGQGL
jgi:hypothetical protein